MKKVLLLLACLPCTMFGIDKAKTMQYVDNAMTMEAGHMKGWLNYKKAKYDATIELMKKHLDQIIELKRKGLSKISTGTDMQAYMADKLNEWISMHEEQTKEWKEFHEAQHKMAKELAESHKKELTSFKELKMFHLCTKFKCRCSPFFSSISTT